MNHRKLPQETGQALSSLSRRLATVSPLGPDVKFNEWVHELILRKRRVVFKDRERSVPTFQSAPYMA
jgi:hypothetical protein